MSNKEYCHWMPCTIEHDGIAPISMYFQPETLAEEPSSVSSNEKELAKGDNSEQGHAASFRGRALMACREYKLPENINGTVFIPMQSNDTKLEKCETFNSILEWEHEHETKSLIQSFHCNDVYSDSSVSKGLAMMDLLKSVHDPIPTED